MNERIKELIKQATNPDYDSDDGPMNEINIEKFAELIVRECMDAVCDPSTTYLESMTDASAMYTAREKIRKHFRS